MHNHQERSACFKPSIPAGAGRSMAQRDCIYSYCASAGALNEKQQLEQNRQPWIGQTVETESVFLCFAWKRLPSRVLHSLVPGRRFSFCSVCNQVIGGRGARDLRQGVRKEKEFQPQKITTLNPFRAVIIISPLHGFASAQIIGAPNNSWNASSSKYCEEGIQATSDCAGFDTCWLLSRSGHRRSV